MPFSLTRLQSLVLQPLFTAVRYPGGRCVDFTRLSFFLYWAAREGYKPCVFAVSGSAGGDRRLYSVWGLKGFSGVSACVIRAATAGGSPGRQNPL